MDELTQIKQITSTYGDFLLRLLVGIIFIVAGYGKLFASPGIEGFTGMLSGLGFPIPVVFAILVGVLELVGGVLLIVGFYDNIASATLAFIMLVALVSVTIPGGEKNRIFYDSLLFLSLIRYSGVNYTIKSVFSNG